MRTRKLLLAALWLSFPAFAQSAQSVCGGLLMGEERVRCMPDQTLEICIEIPDGFRLHWERVRKTEDLVLAATEPNWAVARCRDLR